VATRVQLSDPWADWIRRRRHGADPAALERMLAFLAPVRDRVIEGADLREDDVLLDVGCGDGLIAFAALDRVATVVFCDVSQELLDLCSEHAGELGALDRCRFVRAGAERLDGIADASVDAVTTRSVLMYVEDKRAAFDEFRRVLRPGGRLSIFEPVNRFGFPEPPGRLLGYDVAPVEPLATKVKAVLYEPAARSPMLEFDERDLLALAEGFESVRLRYEAEVHARSPHDVAMPWDTFLATSGNPLSPTVGDAVEAALTAAESRELEAHLRPLVEQGHASVRLATAYLSATR
jgi:arsenite methyltransferase